MIYVSRFQNSNATFHLPQLQMKKKWLIICNLAGIHQHKSSNRASFYSIMGPTARKNIIDCTKFKKLTARLGWSIEVLFFAKPLQNPNTCIYKQNCIKHQLLARVAQLQWWQSISSLLGRIQLHKQLQTPSQSIAKL